jgi:hypothetical protein
MSISILFGKYEVKDKASYTNIYPVCLMNMVAMVRLNKHVIQSMSK